MSEYKIEFITPKSEDFEFLYGIETGIWINDKLPIKDSDFSVKIGCLSIEKIIKRFGNLLTKEQIKNLKNDK